MAALVLLAAGCDLFRTRSVEPPLNNGQGITYPPPIQPDQLFLNLKNSLTDLNSQEYLNCFFAPGDPGGSYQFEPDPNVTGWPLAGPWGYQEESQTIQYLFTLMSSGERPFLTLAEQSRMNYGIDDSVKIRQIYTLVAPTQEPTLPQQVHGEADFILAKNETGFWAILRWLDLHGLNGDPSWTALKAGLYSP